MVILEDFYALIMNRVIIEILINFGKFIYKYIKFQLISL